MRRIGAYACSVLFILIIAYPAISFAGMLMNFSDTLTNSGPSRMSSHTIEFTLSNDVPVGGAIIVTPAPEFIIPPLFDYTDVDLAVATTTGGLFIDRLLTGTISTSSDLVGVTTGTSSSLTVTLGAGDGGMSAGDIIQIELGTVARHQGFGDQLISNPTEVGSYRINAETRGASNALIDAWNTLVAIVQPVGVGPVDTIDDTPPSISNVLPPTGILLQAGTQNIQVSLETDELSTCRYSDTQGTPFNSMTDFFDQTIPSAEHTVTLTDLENDTTYTIYIRCADPQNNSSSEVELEFAIGVIPLEPGQGGVQTGPPGESGDGVGGGPFDFGGPYIGNSRVTLSGISYPGSAVYIIRDGESEQRLTAGSSGAFSTVVENLVRGTYTFGIYAEDADGRRSSTYSTTISISAETGNAISRIFLPPTIALVDDTVDPGDDFEVYGQAVSGSSVEVYLGKRVRLGESGLIVATTTASAAGNWSVVFSSSELSVETYEIKARSTVPGEIDPGDFSASTYVGIGGEPDPDFSLRADLNRDGFVNIVDFSILVFNWETSDVIADINLDGSVGLTDFSIMLFYWTG